MAMTKKDLKMKQLEDRAAYDNLLRGYLSDRRHRRPQTRRDFLTSGIALFASTSVIPTLAQLVSVSAWAADCGGAASANTVPVYINIQLSGGAALFANYVARGNNGSPISPNIMGMGSAPTIDTSIFANGAPMWNEPDLLNPQGTLNASSGMVRGLLATLPKNDTTFGGIYSKTSFVAIACESLDDRNTNKNDISGMLSAAGIAGSSLPHLYTGYGSALGEGTALPANLFASALMNPATMLRVDSPAGIQGGLSFKGALAKPGIDSKVVVAAIEELSRYQVEALVNNPNSSESKKAFADLVKCSTAKNKTVMENSKSADFYSGPFDHKTELNAIWARNKDQAQHSNSDLISKGLTTARLNEIITRSGLVVANCMNGFSAATTINLGGYDYHFSQYNRREAFYKDHLFGDVIARILKTAQVFNRKVFIHVSSDGSVNSPSSTDAFVNWNGENQKRGMNYMIAYNPAGAPATAGYTLGGYSDSAHQLNHFLSDATVNNANPIGSADAQELNAAAVFLNYLSFANMTSKIDLPALAPVKNRLVSSLPAGASNIYDYFTRFKGG